ncbi:hypothetical protein BLA60_24725 [Actinophytocola xinjiangensis]|uniref:Uncharacterized protein n=1 Tax=Actinophytocola xinjiangensis TaxID=485602 RepID=A0A7Z0WJB2_9PSEU|nr:hypothetical protein BLA60_24725 [Actinophytocola xinjiangensis]
MCRPPAWSVSSTPSIFVDGSGLDSTGWNGAGAGVCPPAWSPFWPAFGSLPVLLLQPPSRARTAVRATAVRVMSMVIVSRSVPPLVSVWPRPLRRVGAGYLDFCG